MMPRLVQKRKIEGLHSLMVMEVIKAKGKSDKGFKWLHAKN